MVFFTVCGQYHAVRAFIKACVRTLLHFSGFYWHFSLFFGLKIVSDDDFFVTIRALLQYSCICAVVSGLFSFKKR